MGNFLPFHLLSTVDLLKGIGEKIIKEAKTRAKALSNESSLQTAQST